MSTITIALSVQIDADADLDAQAAAAVDRIDNAITNLQLSGIAITAVDVDDWWYS